MNKIQLFLLTFLTWRNNPRTKKHLSNERDANPIPSLIHEALDTVANCDEVSEGKSAMDSLIFKFAGMPNEGIPFPLNMYEYVFFFPLQYPTNTG